MAEFFLTDLDDVFPASGQDNSGDDWIFGKTGKDLIDAGDGNDLVVVVDGGDTVSGGTGNDTIEGDGTEVGVVFFGEGGDDSLRGSFINDRLFGGAGNDTLWGLQGQDRIFGGAGDDYAFVYARRHPSDPTHVDVLKGGAGFDTAYIKAEASPHYKHPSPPMDVMADFTGDVWQMEINHRRGPVLTGFESVLLTTEDGNDVLRGGDEIDEFRSEGGTDAMYGGGGNDVLKYYGDSVYSESITLKGGSGDDQILAGLTGYYDAVPVSRLDGGAGTDELSLSFGLSDRLLPTAATIVFLDGTLRVWNNHVLVATAKNFESLVLKDYTGNSNVTTGGGDDTIFLYGGDDVLQAGAGDDQINKGLGTYWLDGGSGYDVLTIDTLTSSHALLFDGRDVIGSVTSNYDGYIRGSFCGFEAFNVVGTDGNDTLIGGDGNDTLSGGKGFEGHDRVDGGGGADELFGSRFIYRHSTDSTSDAMDSLHFYHDDARVQHIDLSAIDDRHQAGAADFFTFIGTDAFTAEGQIRVWQDGADTVVEVNANGVAGAEMQIRLLFFTATELTADDFIL